MAEGHLSEAACLIEQGATYRRRLGLQPVHSAGEPIFAGFKPGAFAVYFGDAPFYHFDLEGRWQRAFVDGTHFLKALDGTVQSIDRVREGPNLVLKRRTLEAAAADFDSQVRNMALSLIGELDAGNLNRIEPASPRATPILPEELRGFLEQITRWNSAAWLTDRQRYEAAYRAMPFLPPECANAVVLEATFGHNIQFGSGRPVIGEPHRRTTDEFEHHARAVAALWGRRLLQCRTVFLAGSDALLLPFAAVKSHLTTINEVLTASAGNETARFDEIHAFLDDFIQGRPDRDSWKQFAALGLNRVSIGIASGDPAVRALYHQRWSDQDLRAAFADLKSAGIGASVLTLVGAGGLDHALSHVKKTAALIESLALSPGDFVFLLDENELHDTEHLSRQPPFSGPAWLEQQSHLKQALAALKARKVKVLPYTMEKQRI